MDRELLNLIALLLDIAHAGDCECKWWEPEEGTCITCKLRGAFEDTPESTLNQLRELIK